jgi:hypothetical protein
MRHFYCSNCELVLKWNEVRHKPRYGEFGVGLSILDKVIFDYCDACGHEVHECIPCTRCHSALHADGADECQACCDELDAEIAAMANIARVL